MNLNKLKCACVSAMALLGSCTQVAVNPYIDEDGYDRMPCDLARAPVREFDEEGLQVPACMKDYDENGIDQTSKVKEQDLYKQNKDIPYMDVDKGLISGMQKPQKVASAKTHNLKQKMRDFILTIA